MTDNDIHFTAGFSIANDSSQCLIFFHHVIWWQMQSNQLVKFQLEEKLVQKA